MRVYFSAKASDFTSGLLNFVANFFKSIKRKKYFAYRNNNFIKDIIRTVLRLFDIFIVFILQIVNNNDYNVYI